MFYYNNSLLASVILESPLQPIVPGSYPSTSGSAPHSLGHSNGFVGTWQHPSVGQHQLYTPPGCSDSSSSKHWAIIKPQDPQALQLATGTWLRPPEGPETPHTAGLHSQLPKRPNLPAGWLPEGSGVGVRAKQLRGLKDSDLGLYNK